jgi:hypothetical protein
MRCFLSSLPSAPRIADPEPSLWTEIPKCESKAEVQAAFMKGTVHFTGTLKIKRDEYKREKLVFRLSPAAAGMGSALYRRFGSDRFFVCFYPVASPCSSLPSILTIPPFPAHHPRRRRHPPRRSFLRVEPSLDEGRPHARTDRHLLQAPSRHSWSFLPPFLLERRGGGVLV